MIIIQTASTGGLLSAIYLSTKEKVDIITPFQPLMSIKDPYRSSEIIGEKVGRRIKELIKVNERFMAVNRAFKRSIIGKIKEINIIGKEGQKEWNKYGKKKDENGRIGRMKKIMKNGVENNLNKKLYVIDIDSFLRELFSIADTFCFIAPLMEIEEIKKIETKKRIKDYKRRDDKRVGVKVKDLKERKYFILKPRKVLIFDDIHEKIGIVKHFPILEITIRDNRNKEKLIIHETSKGRVREIWSKRRVLIGNKEAIEEVIRFYDINPSKIERDYRLRPKRLKQLPFGVSSIKWPRFLDQEIKNLQKIDHIISKG